MQSSTPDGQTATAPTQREECFAGMSCVDTSHNPRIPILMEMVGALSRAKTPREVLRDFSRGITQLQGVRGYISLSTRGLKPGEYRITRLITDESVADIDVADPWRNRDELQIQTGGFLGEIIRQAYPEIIHHLDIPDDPVIGNALAEFGSLMAIPLFDDGEPLNWAILLRRDPEGYTVADLEENILRTNLVGTTVRNVLAADELREAHEEIRAEVQQIADIQRALLPDPLPDIPGVSLGASYETFDQAGGDYYDLRPLARQADGSPDLNGPWGILIADASGHGPAAAVLMAMLHAIVHAYPHEPESPAEILAHANRHLEAKRIESSFVTAFFAIYEPNTKRLRYARAGHNPPVLMRKVGDDWDMVRLEGEGGLPLGIIDNADYEDAAIDLDSGQTIVFYTDGITEAASPDGTQFGVEGIERSLTTCTGDPDCVINHVTSALLEHEAGKRPNDDQTLVVFRVQ